MDRALGMHQSQGGANLLDVAQARGHADPAGRLDVRQERKTVHVLHDQEGAVVPLGQQSQVMDLDQVAAAGMVRVGQQAGQGQRVAEQVAGGRFGQAGLVRHLDRHRPNEVPAKVLVGPEDRAKRAAGAGLEQLVLAAEQALRPVVRGNGTGLHGGVASPHSLVSL